MNQSPDDQDAKRNFENLCAAWWDAMELIARRQAQQATQSA